jgi:hypothetical protein
MKSTSRLFRFKDWLFDPPVTGHAATAIMRFMAGGDRGPWTRVCTADASSPLLP